MSTKPSFLDRPKLRKVERFEDRDHREPRVILHDPLGVAEAVSLPLEYAPALDLMDGTRTLAQVGQSLRMRWNLEVDREDLEGFVADLSSAGWLDDDSFRAHRAALVGAFETHPGRVPHWADVLYPANPDSLTALCEQTLGPRPGFVPSSDTIGVMVPHGPPELVGRVAGPTLRQLPPAGEIDLIIIVGTDHHDGLHPVVATHRAYETPWGPTTLARASVDALERRVPWICREELRHQRALSLELAHLYLHYAYGSALPPVLPLLCGASFAEPRACNERSELLGALETITSKARILWYGSAELSHTGPAYGDTASDEHPSDLAEAHDRAVLDALRRGSAASVRSHCGDATSPYRPSGGAVMSFLADALPVGFRTELVAYERCPVPGDTPGHAGLAGLRFRG